MIFLPVNWPRRIGAVFFSGRGRFPSNRFENFDRFGPFSLLTVARRWPSVRP